MKPLADIAAAYDRRRTERGPLMQSWREVRDTYNGDVVLPMPELDVQERPAIANLLQKGIDGLAQRIVSAGQDLRFAPRRAGFDWAEEEARRRRQAGLGWWERSQKRLVDLRRARHLPAYASSPVVIVPDFKLGIPRWDVRNPLGCYPGSDDMAVPDAIFAVTCPVGDLRGRYWEHLSFLPPNAGTCDLLEYFDAEERVLCVVGSCDGRPDLTVETDYGAKGNRILHVAPGGKGFTYVQLLQRALNQAKGLCPVVVPGRITLDRLLSQYEGMIGKYVAQARLAALELIAIEEGVFPREWIVARQGETNPQIIVQADGRRGIVGKVTGGDLRATYLNPGYKTNEAIDRLERESRLEGGIPADWGGESPSNVRTARRGGQVLSEAVDYNLAEYHTLLEASGELEMERAVATAVGYFRSRKVSFHVDWKGAKGPVTYTAGELFGEGPVVAKVRYPLVGSDLNGQILRVGQKLSIGIVSQQTAREQDPEIDDPEGEHDRVVFEALERAALTSVEQMAVAGQMPVTEISRIARLVRTGERDLFDAIDKAHLEAQERQASTVAPVEPGAPEAQPGLALPGAGAEAGTVVPPEEPSMENLVQRLRGLRTVSQIAQAV